MTMWLYEYGIDIGDVSGDGYDKVVNVRFKTNLDIYKIGEAYKKFNDKYKVGFTEGNGKVCFFSDFEEDNLSADVIDDLIRIGVDMTSFDYDRKGKLYFYTKDVVVLLLEMARVIEPTLRYEIMEKSSTVNDILRSYGVDYNIGYGVVYL